MASPERRILLVEDEPTLQRILGSVLGDAGHVVESVGTAEAAVARLDDRSAEKIDLVLSDKNLPGISGLNLLEHLRETERDEDLDRGFVLVTGYPSRDSALVLMEHGANGYLVKPFRSLIHAVEVITQIMDAPLRDYRVATDLAQAAAASFLDDDSKPFLPKTQVTVLLDDPAHHAHLSDRATKRGGDVVDLDSLRSSVGVPKILVAARFEDLAAFAKEHPQTGLILADGGASFRALQAVIRAGGGAVVDPTLVPGAA